MSYYNSPGLHVQHMGPSHGITVSILKKQIIVANVSLIFYVMIACP